MVHNVAALLIPLAPWAFQTSWSECFDHLVLAAKETVVDPLAERRVDGRGGKGRTDGEAVGRLQGVCFDVEA